MTRQALGLALALAALSGSQQAGAGARLLEVGDLARIADVSDPQLSPTSPWIAYTVRSSDLKKDKLSSDLWMVHARSGETVQLTRTPDSETTPRWSPDGKRLGFLSSRGVENEADQLWQLNLTGGEAEQITRLEGSVEDFAFAPDGQRVVLVVLDPDPAAPKPDEKDQTAAPIVIDRFYFKEDGTGYLGARRKHLVLLDLRTRETTALTTGPFDELKPSWSPDGRLIAFHSKRSGDPDRNETWGLYVIEPRADAPARQVTEYVGQGADTEWAPPAEWSPDGQQLAFVAGGDPKWLYYAGYGVATVPVAGGDPVRLTAGLDRNTVQPTWTADGRSLRFLIEDDRNSHLASVAAVGGKVRRLSEGRRNIQAYSASGDGRVALVQTTVDRPAEIFTFDRGKLRQLSHHNDALLAEVKLASVEEIQAKSRDGTPIHGFLVKPPGFEAGRRYPTVLRIHGGPVSQYSNSFMFEWQLLAAQGYVVVAGNPRGSSGRGEAFSQAIFADWGNKDSEDVLALVDFAVAAGIADPARLGVGGWSYGGILTNQVIARDARFKAATSGASIANVLAGYGTDMYIREYETELGTPWQNFEVWKRNSFPFLYADRINTPTLFLCGESDFNVPLLNSEQMYQALRSRDVPTQLVIYPGQGHQLVKPSYLRHRLEQYLAWYARYLK